MNIHLTSKNNGHILQWVMTIIFLFSVARVDAQSSQVDLQVMMEHYGLIDIQSIDSTIMVDLKYATTDNFMRKNMYGSLHKAYILPHMAEKLKKANSLLKALSKDSLCLIIYDAARPQSVQKDMYDQVKDTPQKVYVARPDKGGRHNFGVAVDLSIWDKRIDKPMDMGTPFDHFGETAHVDKDALLIQKGLLKKEHIQNRQLLISIMRQVGLRPYRREWWHYEEPMSISEVRQRFKLLDF